MLGTIDVNVTPVEGCKAKRPDDSNSTSSCDKQVERAGLKAEISKQVVRKKLAKQRHLVVEKAIHPEYLDSLFPALLEHFEPQVVNVSGCSSRFRPDTTLAIVPLKDILPTFHYLVSVQRRSSQGQRMED
jgi:hypothetical protein